MKMVELNATPHRVRRQNFPLSGCGSKLAAATSEADYYDVVNRLESLAA
jgi:hypothetical protein